MRNTIKVNEIFKSIQGESTFAGLPCIFIRLTGCNLRCKYCDTAYAYYEGRDWNINQLLEYIKKFQCGLVEITGGEPLIQTETLNLIRALLSRDSRVLVETNGSIDISSIDRKATVIMDIKCPGSGMSKKNLWENINQLKHTDEVKFVVENKRDYIWAKSKMNKFNLAGRCNVLFSPVYGRLDPHVLAEWILNDNLDVRFQLQQHKYIWDPWKRSV
jgi:7-carboxy-7-deazaguanine synthase